MEIKSHRRKLLRSIQFVLLTGLFALSFSGFASPKGYRIKFQINGLTDTICYLANYYGDKTYLVDTSLVDKKGRFVFEGDTVLPGGIYIVAGQHNNRILEFIVDKSQQFSVMSDVSDITGKIKFTGSPENDLFFEYINKNIHDRKAIEKLNSDKKSVVDQPDSLAKINKSIEGLTEDLNKFQENLIKANPGSFVAELLTAMKEPDPGNIPVLENGKQDSVYAYQYYKKHYWDNFNLTDARLLRTPLFDKRIEAFFTKVVLQNPDSIIKEADLFITRTRDSKEVFKYSVWFLTYKFETSKIMGFDKIFVHMVDMYYAKGEAFWADSTLLKSMEKKADEIRPVLIGNIAPELILIDTSGSFISLHHTTANYLVLIFYESDCGHCKTEIESLKNWYENNEIGFQVFAVCTDTSLVKWKKFINKEKLTWVNANGTRSITPDYHQLYNVTMTPTLFLLDEKKQIIAKQLKTDQLKPFLENFIKKQ